jgi:hypothetical protein
MAQRAHLVRFVDPDELNATNNRAGRQVRPGLIARKLPAWNSTEAGAETAAGSIHPTRRERGRRGGSVSRGVVDQQRDHRPEVESRLAAIVANVTAAPGALQGIAQDGLACHQSHGPDILDTRTDRRSSRASARPGRPAGGSAGPGHCGSIRDPFESPVLGQDKTGSWASWRARMLTTRAVSCASKWECASRMDRAR